MRLIGRIAFLVTLSLLLTTLLCAWTGKVIQVIDGDTVVVSKEGKGVSIAEESYYDDKIGIQLIRQLPACND
jgi:endonuclease YncB( thermonuclease family)